MVKKKNCDICSEKNINPGHEQTEKHQWNEILHVYSSNKNKFAKNRNGIIVECDVRSSFSMHKKNTDARIALSAKPTEEVQFNFTIINNNTTDIIRIDFIQMLHSKTNFHLNYHLDLQPLKPGTQIKKAVSIKFKSAHIGQYEVPVFFSFHDIRTRKNIIIVRDVAVYVEETQSIHEKEISPYSKKEVLARVLVKKIMPRYNDDKHRIPPQLKTIFTSGLHVNDKAPEDEIAKVKSIKDVFDIGVTKDNYKKYFQYLLWYEEAVVKSNYKNYNMSDVTIQQSEAHNSYYLAVPGLAVKRPSLLSGDLLFVKPVKANIMFEAMITAIKECNIIEISGLNSDFKNYYNQNALFDIRFFLSRLTLERMHHAITNIQQMGHEGRIFPERNPKIPVVQSITKFFNPLVRDNKEQRTAVEHIVSETSGIAPYLIHGPPGTGKTVTIVEAILQLVLKNSKNSILVCTDSNNSADYIATMLVKYVNYFPDRKGKLLLRANSRFRTWDIPEALKSYSNGMTSSEYKNVPITKFRSYNIVVTTLSHAAKFAKQLRNDKPHITHLFIDEAAQASEPACLIPASGLLHPKGLLVLAGDPLQLGPVVISHKAKEIGLGLSLMERLKSKCSLYSDARNDPNYIVMLRSNFRSHPDILQIPNDLFYNGQLRCMSNMDRLSQLDILGVKSQSRAIVFHSVISKEQRLGKSPSFFNIMELEVVRHYVLSLIKRHKIPQEDIGIISPYIRQVHKIKDWLEEQGYYNIEVGTVEAFQGREKRIVIITTVRGKCDFTKSAGKFKIGFLSDPKRFNVALTRAKAKTIIIGNPINLQKDPMWNTYIKSCRQMGTFLGYNVEPLDEQIQRSIVDQISPLLSELTI
ncbi:putative helicase mov-10-B.1 [Galleria mellonella]|uniref:RNA helicase n=1 Tax=Galleria mellonella TaxID=7137 RepID=A0ABM3MZ74_GALME|nr:putative helicase mov-10-B.1 [Galleria mellonella]XP_052756473.1 putative helicase mov-10-B.1 [Galleria mellonella]